MNRDLTVILFMRSLSVLSNIFFILCVCIK